ncbi:MAG: lipoyl(octanoyl) transferase LipB [bacterium]
MHQSPPPVRIIRHERIHYRWCTDYQKQLADEIATGTSPETTILTEHYHVYTMGRLASHQEILHKPPHIDIVATQRGGRVTYHGPGQLVVYPVLNLLRVGRDIRKYISLLEQSVIMTLDCLGIKGTRSHLHPGVWIKGKKIASIGIQIHRGIAFHGLAINRNPALDLFKNIIPCGVHSLRMTSLEKEGILVCRNDLENIFINQFKKALNLTLWDTYHNG